MASKKSKELWQKAIPISEAWIKFAPTELLAKYQKLQDPSKWDVHFKQEGFFNRTFEAVGIFGNIHTQKNNLENQLKKQLESGLLDGRYIAFGFREAPTRGNGPVQIGTSDSRSIEIDWQEEELSTYDYTYSRVGILSQDVFAAFTKKQASSGAKNAKISIRNAIKNLMDRDPDFVELTRKQQSQKVRDEINISHTKYDGYSDKNIEKYLFEICGPKRK